MPLRRLSWFLTVLFVAVACLASPVTAHALTAPSYVCLEGVDILGEQNQTIEYADGGVASYEPTSQTLTLENVTLDTYGTSTTGAGGVIVTDGDLVISLVGTNRVEATGPSAPKNATCIQPMNGQQQTTITFTGGPRDSLIIIGPNGIYTNGADVVVKGCHLDLQASVSGISITNRGGSITVKDSATVSGNCGGYGLVTYDGEVVVSSATISLTRSTNDAAGLIYATDGISVSDSSVSIANESAKSYNLLMTANGAPINISNSTVTARGGSRVIRTSGTLSVSGNSTVTAIGGLNIGTLTLDPSTDQMLDLLVGSSEANAQHFGESPFGSTTSIADGSELSSFFYARIQQHTHVFDQQDASPRFLAQEATCTEPAHYYLSCACDVTSGETFEAGEPLGHDLEQVAEISPTCTGSGVAEHWTCSRCDSLFSDAAGTEPATEESLVLPALGHDLEHVAEVAATCTESGVAEHWTCARCDTLFSDEAGTKTVSADELALPALGHRFENGVCAVCGAKDPDYVEPKDPEGTDAKTEKGDVIPATGNPTSPVAAASALAGGALLVAGALSRRRSR